MVMLVAICCLILIIYYERILLYKVRKLFKRKDVNMCVCFKVQVEKGCLPPCLRKYYFKYIIILIISTVPWEHIHTD